MWGVDIGTTGPVFLVVYITFRGSAGGSATSDHGVGS